MHHKLTPDEEYLYILDAKGNVTGADTRRIAHDKGLIHGHCDLWVPSEREGYVVVQNRKPKLINGIPVRELDSTVGGHIDCDPHTISEHIGKHISIVGRKSVIKETGEESGLTIEDHDFDYIDTYSNQDDPRHNQYFTPVYLLKQKVSPEAMISENGRNFVQMRLEKILNLPKSDPSFVRAISQDTYKRILETIQERIQKMA